ncbi:MAG: SPOR domain-containing protein, partial [Gammaproteobacteria bacterium]|nr:SPOR domain-containing protein [Gammaproteobacteria bacterium]
LGVAETGTAPVTIRVIETARPEALSAKESVTGAGKNTIAEGQVAASEIGKLEVGVEKQSAEVLTGDYFYVQVAAFTSEENALRMLSDLTEKKFTGVRIHVENEQGKVLYRVRIGPLPTEESAEKLLLQLKEINHHNVRIVAYK